MQETKLKRVENDFYPTESALTELLLKRISVAGKTVLEPCCGEGHISKVLESHGTKRVINSDVTWSNGINRDATLPEFWQRYSNVDWIITNPPFNQAHKILPLAFDCANGGIAFLLRLSYLEPAGNRGEWLKAHADNLRFVIPVNPRPQFRADTKGTDSVTAAWCVWDKRWSWEASGVQCPFVFENQWR